MACVALTSCSGMSGESGWLRTRPVRYVQHFAAFLILYPPTNKIMQKHQHLSLVIICSTIHSVTLIKICILIMLHVIMNNNNNNYNNNDDKIVMGKCNATVPAE